MARQLSTLLALAVLLPGAVTAQGYPPIAGDSLNAHRVTAPRATDSTVNQKWTSEFGYSVLLPSVARYNKIGSTFNRGGVTEKQNFMIPGGNGSITLYHFMEPRQVPKDFKLRDSLHYYQYDSTGRNGMIHRRIYVLHDRAVMMEILLTEKGEAAFGAVVPAIFDSFEPQPGAVFWLEGWRYGRNPAEYQHGRYGPNTGPGH